MIIGIGSDLINVRRIESDLEKHGDKFVARLFTESERAYAEGRVHPARTYAKRFAAKEACAKALGTGIAQGLLFKEMGVKNLPSGRPTLTLSGEAQKHLDSLVPQGMKAAIHLTITDDYPWAQAFVVIEAIPC